MIASVRGSVAASLFRISRAWASTATLAGMASRIAFQGPTTSDVVSGGKSYRAYLVRHVACMRASRTAARMDRCMGPR